MKIAFCLFMYYPFGGLQRDFMRIADLCRRRGHSITVYVREWQGSIPPGFDVRFISVRSWLNHARDRAFIEQLKTELRTSHYDLLVGFNRMPGLDVYYAADPCYVEDSPGMIKKSFYRLTGRYQHHSHCERGIFGRDAKTVALLLTEKQKALFEKHYHTPPSRLVVLPPGIEKRFIQTVDEKQIRSRFRQSVGVPEHEKIALMLGSCFATKGLDRALHGLAQLPRALRHKTHLFVVGVGSRQRYKKLSARLGIASHLRFFGGQYDVRKFLLSADCLLQPSYHETAGIAILEAIVSGLPVLATENCGYACHVEKACAGKVAKLPFDASEFARLFHELLVSPERKSWIRNAISYAKTADLYSMPSRATEVIEAVAAWKKAGNCCDGVFS